MTMSWRNLLFAHWPLPAEQIRTLVPASLELDLIDGQAWLSLAPFAMRNVGPRFANRAPWLSRFLELNVRTYVTAGGKPGVYFFSLNAANRIAVEIGRRFFHLPYFNARIEQREETGWIVYSCERIDQRLGSGRFQGRYRPAGPVYRSTPGDLDHWLTERYCLYAVDLRDRVHRCDIHHHQWPLQPAEAEIEIDSVVDAHGIRLPKILPLLHFAKSLDVVAWKPIQLG